jgi:hypothetical protein
LDAGYLNTGIYLREGWNMWNIIKAQLYQLRKNKKLLFIGIAVIIMEFTNVFGEALYEGSSFVFADYLAENGANMVAISYLFIIPLVAEICGGDFKDKTANYELMAGHTRKDIYTARVILSIICGLLGAVLVMSIPIIYGTATCGLNRYLSVSGFLYRCLIAIFPMIRIICVFVFLSFLIKNSYIVMFLSILTFSLGEILMTFQSGFTEMLGMTNIISLFSFDVWSVYSGTTSDAVLHTAYDTSLSMGYTVGTIAISLVMGGLFLYMGYSYFKRDDLL